MPSVRRIGKYGICDEFHHMFQKQKCAQCKQIFYTSVPIPEWGYNLKVNSQYRMFCTYGCMRKYEVKLQEKERKKMAKEFLMAGNEEIHDVLMARAF